MTTVRDRIHNLWYILNEEHIPIPCEMLEFGQWYDNSANRIVAQEDAGQVWVSTVFLGIDHNFGEDGPPILFETMVFSRDRSKSDLYCQRYTTWELALEGHRETCRRAILGAFDRDEEGD